MKAPICPNCSEQLILLHICSFSLPPDTTYTAGVCHQCRETFIGLPGNRLMLLKESKFTTIKAFCKAGDFNYMLQSPDIYIDYHPKKL